jgi:hypothetical protein
LNYKFLGALRVNASVFHPQNFTADSINNLSFEDLFTLHTNQTFNNLVSVLGSIKVKNPLVVRGAVNRLSLEQERENTVMVRTKFVKIFELF